MTFGINGLNIFGSSLPFISWQYLGVIPRFVGAASPIPNLLNFGSPIVPFSYTSCAASPISSLFNFGSPIAVPFFTPSVQLPMLQPSSSIFNPMNFNIQNPLQSIGNIQNNQQGQAVSLEEIERAGLKFARPGRDRARWSQMNPKFQSDLLKLLNFARSKGITVTMVSGLRTEAEQQHLLASGAPAAPKGSLHLTGRAIDIRVSGNRTQNLAILGNYWKSLGNRWGQDFKKVREPWHFDIGRTG